MHRLFPSSARSAPGPGRLEVLGSLPLILGDRLGWMEEVFRKHGDIARLPLGPRTVHVVFHPDYIRHVLVTNAKNYWKGRTFEKTSGYLGKGLATAEGEAWQAQRRRMNPQFHRDALAGLSSIVCACIDRMLDRWSGAAKKGELVDLSVELQRLAMEVVARSLFGSEVLEEKIAAIIQSIKVALAYTTARTLNPFDVSERLPLPGNLKFRKAIAVLDEVVYGIIEEERRRQPPSGNLLSLLIHARDPETGLGMPAEQLRDEVMTMFLGGTDTSGNTMSWVFYNLHRHPELRERVTREAERAGSIPDPAKLDLARRVTEETLRLYPQNWVGSRDAYAADTIGGYEIPAGSTVFLGVYIAHRRADFWKDPLAFDPDRFLPEAVKGRHPMAYLPFGAGTRKCIGFHFAMMEITSTIAMALRRFSFELVDAKSIRRHASWSLWPKPAMLARLVEK